MGDVEGRGDVYPAVLDLLAGGPKRLSQLVAQATGPACNPVALVQTLALLIDSGQVKTLRAHDHVDPGPARRLNLAMAHEMAAGKPFRVMAAPAIGTGIPAQLCDFGMLLAAQRGLKLDVANIVQTTWEMIEGTSIRPRRDNKLLDQKSEVLAYLRQSAEGLLADRLGILKTLGI